MSKTAPNLRRIDAAEMRRIKHMAGQGLTVGEIANHLGRQSSSIRAAAERAGIHIIRIRQRVKWTPAMDKQLRQLYPTHTGEQVADIMGLGISSVYCRAKALGLGKAPGFASQISRQRWAEGRHENSRKHLFKPGQTPSNKGRPASEWMSAEARARVAKTHFKPTKHPRLSHNYRPIGSLRTNAYNTLERKVTDSRSIAPARRWVPVARLVWEAAHGPIPPHHVVRFKDGKHTVIESEITLDRLECIPQHENMRRNSYHNKYPKEVARLIQLRGALNRKINTRTRKNREAEA